METDVLVIFVGHNNPQFLRDSAQAFEHWNRASKTRSLVAFAVDDNPLAHSYLKEYYGDRKVYNSPVRNGWGRGILRTLIHALAHFDRSISYRHIITVDSDCLVIGPCLDLYTSLIQPRTIFVGSKWGGVLPEEATARNPTPMPYDRFGCEKLFHSGILGNRKWAYKNYLMAGPFVLWTEECLQLMREIGMRDPGPFDQNYPNFVLPHDQFTSFLLGVDNYEHQEVGDVAAMYCGNVGGSDFWKNGFPTKKHPIYGWVPDVGQGTKVIHPIRSAHLDENMVRAYFRTLRK